MSQDDVALMQKLKADELVVDAGAPVLLQDATSPQLYTVLHGMGLRYKTLEDGSRQVLNFVFPGDVLGLRANNFDKMVHSVQATTRMTLCVFDRSDIWTVFKRNPERAFDLTWLAAIEEHLLGDALSSLRHRSAMQATAWALLRVYQKADALGLTENQTMPFPFKQRDLADVLGLSLVHMNKTLRRLREQQLAAWSNGHLEITDVKALADLAKVDFETPLHRPLF